MSRLVLESIGRPAVPKTPQASCGAAKLETLDNSIRFMNHILKALANSILFTKSHLENTCTSSSSNRLGDQQLQRLLKLPAVLQSWKHLTTQNYSWITPWKHLTIQDYSWITCWKDLFSFSGQQMKIPSRTSAGSELVVDRLGDQQCQRLPPFSHWVRSRLVCESIGRPAMPIPEHLKALDNSRLFMNQRLKTLDNATLLKNAVVWKTGSTLLLVAATASSNSGSWSGGSRTNSRCLSRCWTSSRPPTGKVGSECRGKKELPASLPSTAHPICQHRANDFHLPTIKTCETPLGHVHCLTPGQRPAPGQGTAACAESLGLARECSKPVALRATARGFGCCMLLLAFACFC